MVVKYLHIDQMQWNSRTLEDYFVLITLVENYFRVSCHIPFISVFHIFWNEEISLYNLSGNTASNIFLSLYRTLLGLDLADKGLKQSSVPRGWPISLFSEIYFILARLLGKTWHLLEELVGSVGRMGAWTHDPYGGCAQDLCICITWELVQNVNVPISNILVQKNSNLKF